MRIGFDARMIGHPGIGRYIKNLLMSMTAVAKDCEFILFGDKTELETCNLGLAAVTIVHWKAPVYSLKEQMSWPFGRYNLDIVHIPHFNVPLGIGKGRGKGKDKLVVTIHDIIYTKFPEYLPFFKRILAKPVIKNAIKKSEQIIAVSENTKKDIIEIAPGAGKKITVIYEAADTVFRVIDDGIYLEEIRKRYNLPDNIILFVGSLKRHKNIERLISAYGRLKKQIPCNLVVIGRYHKQDAEVLRKIVDSGITYLGEVPAEDIVGLYNLAELLVLPSVYEGFGLPVLEAFACGVPVAASNVSSLPEIAQGAGALFNPYDVDDICDKIYSILSNTYLRQGLIEKGLKRVSEFSWRKTAEKTLAVYENVFN